MPETSEESAAKNQEESKSELQSNNKSSDTQSASINVNADDLREVIVSLVNSFNKSLPARKDKIFPTVFVLNDETLKDLNARIVENFSQFKPFPGSSLEFSATVRMPDLSSQKFDNFDRFLSRAGDKINPERLELSWQQSIAFPFATSVLIEVEFVTERPLEDREMELFQHHTAFIKLSVNGNTDEWVEKTFYVLEPVVSSVKLGGIYVPLCIFRNKLFIHIFSHAIGLGACFVAFNKINSIMKRDEYNTREQIVKDIISSQDMSEKFNIFVKEALTPKIEPCGMS